MAPSAAPRVRILGQERALQRLRNTLASGRFHHAWIFSGPQGVGKFTTAIEAARILLDPERTADDAFNARAGGGDSNIQHLIDTNTHPDLHIIRKELALYSDNPQLRERKLRNIPINLLRERVIGGRSGDTTHEAAAYRTAALGHGKVFIIDEAELLDPNGQSAMLKTLEEPPAQTYFFLITSNPNRLFATIRSRCQIVHFNRLSRRDMEEWWKQRADDTGSSKPSAAAAEVRWALEAAEGSPGAALVAREYGFFEWHKALEPMLREMEAGRFPATMGERLGALVEEFAQEWVKRHGKQHTSKDAANKDGARHVLSLLSAQARKRLADAIFEGGADDDVAERWAGVIEALRECERQIEFNVNQKLALENLAAQWNLALNASMVPAPASGRSASSHRSG